MFGWKPKPKKKQLMVEHTLLHQVASGRKIRIRAVLNSNTNEINVEFPNPEQRRYFLKSDEPGLNNALCRIFSQLAPVTKPEKGTRATELGFGPGHPESDSEEK